MALGPELLGLLGPNLNATSDAVAQRRQQSQNIASQPTPGRQLLGLGGGPQASQATLQQPDLQAILQLIQTLQGSPSGPGGIQQGGFSQFNL